MWTNVFKIGGLHQISWFQFLPQDSDLSTQQDRSSRGDQKDAPTLWVISSHLQLQKQGFLSAWTNSFVGPWDPSQGVYNPDDKIKLWLFLPGRRSSVVETAKAAVSKLRVVNSGIWLAPGDSEDVAAALSQALRNCIERALIGDSYRRFGDVFSRIHPFSQNEELFWRGQPTIEFIFAATEEAIFVHVIVSAKHIRPLSSCDMERVLKCSSNSSNERLSVIVSPHGIRGKLTGLCPSDLVKQVYFSSSRLRTSNGSVGLLYNVSQGSTGHLRGQNYYVEVTVGVSHSGMDKALPSNYNYVRNFPKHSAADSSAVDRNIQKEPLDNNSIYERTFIYPAEAVLVPILQTSYARSSLKRFWLQNWIGPSLTDPSVFMHWMDPVDGQWTEHDGIHEQHSYDSSSNSNDSSISSLSSNSSESNYKMTTKAGDLEADADSLTCRQSRLSCNDQMERNNKHGSKRPRVEMLESHGQLGTVPFKSDYAVTGVENDQLGSQWAWDDDDNGICIDMQTLLSEFGDFGDLFENDSLPFGEPPGTAESQALMFSAPDSGEVGASPGGTGAVMDVSDQMLLHVGFPSFDSFNLPSAAAMEEGLIKNEEVVNNTISIPVNCTPSCSTGEFDHLMKAEALMTFAPEYRAIETPLSEFSSSIFKSPYLPKSRNVESSNSSTHSYAYGATPHSPCLEVSDEKPGMPVTSKACRGKHDGNASLRPNFVCPRLESSNELHDQRLITSRNSITSCEGGASSVFISTNPVSSVHIKTTEGTLGGKNLLSSLKTVLATEVDCVMFQAFMCRIRHTLLSSSSLPPIALSKLAGSVGFNQLLGDPNTITDNISSKYEMKKKEVVPVRIAGDMDGGILDGSLNATVGVWRSVGAPKGAKPSNIDASTSLANISFNEDGMLSYAQRQPLQELLDGMALLVQQATSFVDVTLDSDCGDGPYGWLALQEQCRRGLSCGPFMVHAGCGGSLASCHSLDIAGMELIDPLSVEVHASSVISLLQSDIKTALKSAFGNVDGPLSVPDWCRGCGQAGDTGAAGDVFPDDSTVTEGRDSLGTVNMSVGDSISPSQTTASGMSSVKDGGRMGETCQKRSQETSNSESEQLVSRLKPSLFLVPLPAILVGYQDDWLKTSPNSLQHWEKAPFEPYALQKHMTYYVICPDIDPLTSAAADFFQQLGTVYSTCNLGTHSPSLSNQMDIYSGKWASAGFLLLDCPQSMKLESSNSFLVGSISDYFLSLSNGWDLTSFLKSLSKVLKTLKFGSSSLTMNSKDGNGNPCTVIYIICPFPEPAAVLQTVIESSVTVGSIIFSSEKDRRSMLHSQVGKALNCSAVVDEASSSSILTLSGFSIPKLVVQVVTVDAIFRVTNPSLNELVILKETAFAVYNKARRISRRSSNDVVHPSSLSSRSHSVLSQMTSPMSGMWKDCVGQQMGGTSLPREGELDASLRPGTWDNSWQATRTGDFPLQDDIRYMFEPLFVLAEPGSLEHAVSPSAFCNSTSDSSKPYSEDNSVGFMQSASSVTIGETGPVSQLDGSESDGSGSRHSKAPPSLHCSYGWTEDWRWLVCIWTDSRGELLDSHIFPFGGISSRQDTKGLQCLFVQMLQQGCQILQACCSDIGASRPRDFVITRIGCFYELECQEWQKAIYSVGASDVKKWPLHLRQTVPDRIPARSNGALLQQPETSLMQERNLPPSSPYTSHSKSSGFAKSGLGQAAARKQLVGGHSSVDSSRGLFQWVQSISLVTLSIDHSLYLLSQADSTSPGGTQGSTSTTGQSSYVEGFSSVKSLDSTSASWIMIPSPSMRFLTPTPLQLPSRLTAESPPLAHLLHSKGLAVPFSTGFVISKAVPSMRKDSRSICKEEWPSVLSVGIVDYYGSNNAPQEKNGRGSAKQGARSLSSEDFEIETHLILESVAAELHALSWMTVSPAYLERRTALPFHCDMVLRLRRLLYFADKELSRQCEKSQGSI